MNEKGKNFKVEPTLFNTENAPGSTPRKARFTVYRRASNRSRLSVNIASYAPLLHDSNTRTRTNNLRHVIHRHITYPVSTFRPPEIWPDINARTTANAEPQQYKRAIGVAQTEEAKINWNGLGNPSRQGALVDEAHQPKSATKRTSRRAFIVPARQKTSR